MNSKRILSCVAATTFAATLALATPATAAVTFDPATGVGFVGKGDVQLAFSLSNSQLQAQAGSVSFATASTTVTEVSWVCTNTRNENLQERELTTTTSTSRVVSSAARDGKKQITGFNLTGFGSTTSTESTEGPKSNSCPTNWVLTTAAGDPVVVSSTGSLTTSLGGSTVTLLQF
jgi:hypothetical protein